MDLPAQTTVYLKDYTPPPFLISAGRSRYRPRSARTTRVSRRQLVVDRNREAADPTAGLRLDLDEITVESVAIDGVILGARSLHARRPPPDPAERARYLQPDDRQPHQSQAEHQADGNLHLEHRLLQPVRGAGLPAHHAVPRPSGRDGEVHRHAARGQGSLSRAARQRQPHRARRRSRRPALGAGGKTRSRSRPTSSPSSPPSSTAARTASGRAPAERCSCSSLSSPASWTRASSRWSRSSTR